MYKSLAFGKCIRQGVSKHPLGYLLLEYIISLYANVKDLSQEVDKIKTRLWIECRGKVQFIDQRRILTYAIVYRGLQCWHSFIIKHFPRLNNSNKFCQLWFHKYADIQVLIQEIIKPMEIIAEGSLERSPWAILWHGLIHNISNRGNNEEADT